jgi:hypothetical protein
MNEVMGYLGNDKVPITAEDIRYLRSQIMTRAHEIRASEGRNRLSAQDSVYAADEVAAEYGITGHQLQSFLATLEGNVKNKSEATDYAERRRTLLETIAKAQAELEKIPELFRGDYVYVAHEKGRGYVVKQRGGVAHRIYTVGENLNAANDLAQRIDALVIRIAQQEK